MSRFLIVGTGRSGTTYCQAVLRVCGIHCSHQTVFTFDNYVSRGWDWGGWDGEASFMAVPLLEDIKRCEPDTTVVLVTRDPVKVAYSWLQLGLFQGDMPQEYPGLYRVLTEMFPNVLEGETPQRRAMRYCQAWNAHAAQYADVIFDIDSLHPMNLCAAVGHPDKYDPMLTASIATDVNTYRKPR